MNLNITRDEALSLLKKYNKEDFHILHALTVEGVMRYFAETLGYEEDADFWAICGLLHDVDFECFPDLHCKKAPEILAEINASDDIVHAVCSHGYGICCDVEPKHEMEKVLLQQMNSPDLSVRRQECALQKAQKIWNFQV